MRKVQQGRHHIVRLIAWLVTAACVALVSGLPAPKGAINYALLGMLFVLVASALLRTKPYQAPLYLSLLALDFLAVGAVGCGLAQSDTQTVDARILFLTGYLVAVLVALVGARIGAAVLGALAGVMVLGMGLVFTLVEGAQPSALALGAQVALIAVISYHTAFVAGSVRRAARETEVARHVEREIQVREAAAAEIVSFTHALADCNSIPEVAEAALRHLRCHSGLHARAVFLESEGDGVALWEEAGRLDGDQRERRRLHLQECLARAGSNHIVRDVKCNATTLQPARSTSAFRTAVDVPIRVGGRVAGVLLIADPAPDALPQERIGVLVDVARRTSEAIGRLERQRAHEHRRTAMLLRQMREGVLLLGADGQVQLANPAARRVLAACRAEDGDPEAPPRIGDLTLRALKDTPPGVSRRFSATVALEGHDQPMRLACTAIAILDRGQRIGTLITVADVTEEELARGRIVQAERTTLVGQTLAGVAHELNNPLAALIGYADLIDNMEIPEELQKPVSQMKEQALRATRIVRNLLNFARRRNPERVPTSIPELVLGTMELFAYEARIAGVEVHVDIADDVPTVLADKHALQQVLVNLIQNALHALAGRSGPRELRIQARPTRDGVVLSVSDNGPGVPDELRRKVFESFFTTKGPTRGTGLGLALSRAIAQEHGGDLILAPDTGRGATFSLRLPQRHMLRAAAEDALDLDRAQMPGRVLVVDDEASVRETLVAQLGQMGSHVDSAANVIEAQRMLGLHTYDALLVDIRMPGGTGLDLHRHLVETQPFVADRVIFITGDFVNDELTSQALGTGRLLLEKPFTMKELTRALVKLAA